ncbi:hypothetical protein RJ640_010692 [Escallonia rubra]|uniref:DUF4283 domain-containing protein n=1 Tax=Escallonia rubra TaxID=112253 RepID=A0AA88UUJ1_9ASTE|nr:hypothetical protein RJ640_010692 [Escallonia rubra]
MSSISYGNTNTEASDSVARRGWLMPADSARVLDARARWATTLVGKFVNFQKFSTRCIQREVQAHWDGGGFIRIERAKNLYLFHFEREDARDLFLAGSPWNLCGALVVLKALLPNTPIHEHSHVQVVEGDGQPDLRFNYHGRRETMDTEQSVDNLQALIIADDSSLETSSAQAGSNQPSTTTGTQEGASASDAGLPAVTSPVRTGESRRHGTTEVESVLSRVATWLRQERAVDMPGFHACGGQMAAAEAARRSGGQQVPAVALEEEPRQFQGVDLAAVVSSGEL